MAALRCSTIVTALLTSNTTSASNHPLEIVNFAPAPVNKTLIASAEFDPVCDPDATIGIAVATYLSAVTSKHAAQINGGCSRMIGDPWRNRRKCDSPKNGIILFDKAERVFPTAENIGT